MKKPILMFIGTVICSFLFFYGITLTVAALAPSATAIIASLSPFNFTRAHELPLSADRVVPFESPEPEIIVQPYPAQDQLNPPYNPEHASLNWIRIPAIDVNVPVVLSPSMNDTDVIATLAKGAALYPNGVAPGALGNTFISAHSTGEPWKGAHRFAFLRINELKTGDPLYIDWKGTRYAYRIVRSEIITPTPDFRVISDRPVPTISLMACWPLWSTQQRMLIHADLTNVTQLAQRS